MAKGTATPQQLANLKPFTKGDPRIWKGGRCISTSKQLHQLAQEIANEEVGNSKQRANRIERLLRKWLESKDARLQIAFVEYAYGKVPQRAEVTGKDGEPISFTIVERGAPVPIIIDAPTEVSE